MPPSVPEGSLFKHLTGIFSIARPTCRAPARGKLPASTTPAAGFGLYKTDRRWVSTCTQLIDSRTCIVNNLRAA
jgi:hypothetical protein